MPSNSWNIEQCPKTIDSWRSKESLINNITGWVSYEGVSLLLWSKNITITRRKRVWEFLIEGKGVYRSITISNTHSSRLICMYEQFPYRRSILYDLKCQARKWFIRKRCQRHSWWEYQSGWLIVDHFIDGINDHFCYIGITLYAGVSILIGHKHESTLGSEDRTLRYISWCFTARWKTEISHRIGYSCHWSLTRSIIGFQLETVSSISYGSFYSSIWCRTDTISSTWVDRKEAFSFIWRGQDSWNC